MLLYLKCEPCICGWGRAVGKMFLRCEFMFIQTVMRVHPHESDDVPLCMSKYKLVHFCDRVLLCHWDSGEIIPFFHFLSLNKSVSFVKINWMFSKRSHVIKFSTGLHLIRIHQSVMPGHEYFSLFSGSLPCEISANHVIVVLQCLCWEYVFSPKLIFVLLNFLFKHVSFT